MDLTVFHAEFFHTLVDARRQDLDAHVAAVADITRDLRGIAHDARHQRRHELDRIMLFEVARFVSHHAVSRCVRLVERVLREADHIIEDGLRSRAADTVTDTARDFDLAVFVQLAVDEIFFFLQHDGHLLFRHRAAYQIGAAVAVACEIAHNLHNLLLIDQASVGNVKDRRQLRAGVADMGRILFVVDIFWDRVHRTRPVKRDPRDDILEAGRLEVFHKLRHAAAFELEHPAGIAGGDHFVHTRIVVIHLRKIDFDAMIFLDHLECVANDRQIAKPQKVHFEQPQLLDRRHRKLRRRALIRQIQRHIFIDRRLGDHHARRVRGRVTRHTLDRLRHVDNLARFHIGLVHLSEFRTGRERLINRHAQLKRNRLGDLVGLGIADAERPADVAHRLLGFHRTEGDNLRNTILTVFARHVVDDLRPALIAEVDVNIRHADTLRIEKTFKDQIVFDRVDVRNCQTVGDDRSRRRAAPRPDHDLVLLRVIDKIPDNEEIFHVAHRLNRAELILQTLDQMLRRILSVTLDQSVMAKLAQIVAVRHTLRRHEFRQMILAETEVKRTRRGDYIGVLDGFRHSREDFPHLCLALEIELIVRKPHPLLVIERGRGLNRQQHVMRLGVLPPHIMHVVGRRQRNRKFPREAYHIVVDRAFLIETLILQLQIKIPRAEDVQKLLGFSFRARVISVQKPVLHVARQTARKRNDALAVRPQHLLVDARLIVESADKALGYDLDQVLVPRLIFGKQNQVPLSLILVGFLVGHPPRRRIDLAADDRLNPLLLTFFIEIDRAEHHPMVGDCQTLHAQLPGARDHVPDARRPVQQTVFGMYM